jgi:rod shape-determining protein MreC
VDLLADTPVFGRIAEGDLVYTAGGSDSLAPPDIPIGTVKNVIGRSSAEGPLLEVQPSVDLDRLHFVSIIIYQSESEAPTVSSQAGG